MPDYAIEADLKRAFDTLEAKCETYADLFDYYDGEQPLRYSALRLAQTFRRLDVDFRENWCAVVVDSAADRLQLRGWQIDGDDAANDVLAAVWDANDLELDAAETHEAALISGEAYVIVWRDEAGGVELYANDPRATHLFYLPDRPKLPWYAAKRWTDEDERMRLTLYYADRFEHYRSTQKAEDVDDYRSLTLEADPEPNDVGVVPVFHFRRKTRKIVGEVRPIKPLQDRINKLAADMMVGAEFHALPQRYAITAQELTSEELTIAAGLNRFLNFPAGDGEGQETAVGAFPTSDLRNFMEAIDQATNRVAAISRTPKHHFVSATGADISGEALVALEAPLNRKVEKYQERYGATWQNVGAFAAHLAGHDVPRDAVTPVWNEVTTPLPITESTVLVNEVQAGVPLVTALRRRGWTQDEIDQLLTDQKDAADRNRPSLASALMDAQDAFARAGVVDDDSAG